MKEVPIPPANTADKSRLTKLAERAAEQATAGDKDGLRKTERAIDEIVYQLFDLTPDEIVHIEKSLANTDRESTGAEGGEDEE